MNLDAIQVAIYGGATIGALTVVMILTTWLKKLLLISGHGAVILTTVVAAYVAVTIICVAYYPVLGSIMGIVVLTASLAAGADALYVQSDTSKPADIRELAAKPSNIRRPKRRQLGATNDLGDVSDYRRTERGVSRTIVDSEK